MRKGVKTQKNLLKFFSSKTRLFEKKGYHILVRRRFQKNLLKFFRSSQFFLFLKNFAKA